MSAVLFTSEWMGIIIRLYGFIFVLILAGLLIEMVQQAFVFQPVENKVGFIKKQLVKC